MEPGRGRGVQQLRLLQLSLSLTPPRALPPLPLPSRPPPAANAASAPARLTGAGA